MEFVLSELTEQVLTARAAKKSLFIAGGGTKSFYGNQRALLPQDEHYQLDMKAYRGIVNYQPSELVVTARAGTPLAELEAELERGGQMLAFEPPHFGADATVGGCVAAGLAGPRRVAAGGVRDFVLGVRMLDAQGNLASFGGEVMKNVAGYDVSRLLAGSLGIFGALLEVSLKVLPRPLEETTRVLDATQDEALKLFTAWRSQPLPISASAWVPDAAAPERGRLTVRLSGAPPAVSAAVARIGGDELRDAQAWWLGLREQTHAFFSRDMPLWRLALPPTAPALAWGPMLLEWGGGQRWLSGSADAKALRAAAERAGGHATLFRTAGWAEPEGGVFHPLSPGVATITRRLKQELDPSGLFNPGRLYPEL
jgi:glycolate oxidase FAD binding subunit